MARNTFTRLCVDLDDAGNPIGTSWERHVEGEKTGFGTGPQPEPFDRPIEAFAALRGWALARWGEQMQFPA